MNRSSEYKLIVFVFLTFFVPLTSSYAAKGNRARPSALKDYIQFRDLLSFAQGEHRSSRSEVSDVPICVGNVLISNIHQPLCNLREILSEKKQEYFPEDKQYISFPDGTTMQNPYYTGEKTVDEEGFEVPEEIRFGNEVTSPGRTEAAVLQQVEQIRALFATSIENENIPSLAAKQALLERIKSLKVKFSQDQCHSAWASYAAYEHTITICPNATKLPTLSLVPLFAHEMGHTMDLCNAQQQCYKHANRQIPVNQDELIRKLQAQNPNMDIQKIQSEVESYKSNLESLISNNSNDRSVLKRMFDFDTGFNANTIMEHFASLEQQGYVSSVDQGITLENLPITKEYQCLASAFHLRELPQDSTICRGTYFTEQGAQIWSAKITDTYLKENPPEQEWEKYTLFALSPISRNKGNSWGSKETDVNNIFFSQSGIQNLFNCTPTPEQRICVPK